MKYSTKLLMSALHDRSKARINPKGTESGNAIRRFLASELRAERRIEGDKVRNIANRLKLKYAAKFNVDYS